MMASPTDRSYMRPIVAYYNHTWLDYRLAWMRPDNRHLGMHFGYYDENTRSHTQAVLRMNLEMAKLGNFSPGERVLDAGCGVGGSSLWLAQNYGVEVVGITIPPVQVAKARRFAEKKGLSDLLSFERMNFTETTFPDESFDAVWAQESVCHVPLEDKQAFLREAYRLLKPGGRLVVEDWFRLGRSYSDEDEQLMRRWLSGWAIVELATGDEFAEWIEAAGLRLVSREDITRHAHRSIERLRRWSLAWYPAGLFLRGLHLRSAVAHGNQRSARLHWHTYTRRLWCIETMLARKQA